MNNLYIVRLNGEASLYLSKIVHEHQKKPLHIVLFNGTPASSGQENFAITF